MGFKLKNVGRKLAINKKKRYSKEKIKNLKEIEEEKIEKPQKTFESKEKSRIQERGEITKESESDLKTIGISVNEKKFTPTTLTPEKIKQLEKINEVIPLVTIDYKGTQQTLVYANIRWDPTISSLRYDLKEPPLSKQEEQILKETKVLLQEKLNIDFSKIRLEKAFKFLIEKFYQIIDELGYKLTEDQKIRMQYYIYRDFMGLGKIEPLMHDDNIEDISCDGVNIPIFVYHRNPLYGQMRTNIIFRSKEELDSFVLRLSQKAGKALTIADPLLEGSLPDGSRIQATLGTDIARRGSNFTIRKFTKKPMTPTDLLNYNTGSPEMFAYLWMALENRLSILVSGGTATGKTTFLNALSLFIKPEFKIISIEDTPELRLPHPNWVPVVARRGYGKEEYGEVSMFNLLKSSLRQRPDYIIVGEVRGEEAYVLFQGMATGHSGLGTLHADSIEAVIDRLITKPINLPKAMIDNLDIIVFLELIRREGSYVRRVAEILEIVGYDYKTQKLKTNVAFVWDPITDKYISKNSVLLEKIRVRMSYTEDKIKQDMHNRVRLLNWLKENNVNDYKEVTKYISAYYINPELVMSQI